MIQTIRINPNQIKEHTCLEINLQGQFDHFPFLSIDKGSYIVGLEVQSGINFDITAGRHCIAIGKFCSLAESITFLIDLNHDYGAVSQGELTFLKGMERPCRIKRKGSIIIQNDVWIGHGATIMAGVTLHNGCVIAAESVVTKDVPPYAIVGGNPARILRYRFDADIVKGLQRIAWWNWPEQLQTVRRQDFALSASEFVKKHLPEAELSFQRANSVLQPDISVCNKKTVLVFPDFSDNNALYEKIFRQYFAIDRPQLVLLIYLPACASTPQNLHTLDSIMQQYQDRDCDVIIQTGEDLDERILFQHADYYVTTRSRETVYRTCLADLYQVHILYGTDEPIFD